MEVPVEAGLGSEDDLKQRLAKGMSDLAEAEATWGPEDARVALLLRRLALDFERAGKLKQALPLWLRVIEIEASALGLSHPDIEALSQRLRTLMERAGLDEDAQEAYCSRLPVSNPRDSKAATSIEQEPSVGRSGSYAGAFGGAVLGGALNLGFAAASVTSSIATDAAGSVASYGARRLSGFAVRAVAPESVAAPMAAAAEWAAGATCTAAVGTARVGSAVVMGVAQQATVAAASSVTAHVIDYYAMSSTSSQPERPSSPRESPRNSPVASPAASPRNRSSSSSFFSYFTSGGYSNDEEKEKRNNEHQGREDAEVEVTMTGFTEDCPREVRAVSAVTAATTVMTAEPLAGVNSDLATSNVSQTEIQIPDPPSSGSPTYGGEPEAEPLTASAAITTANLRLLTATTATLTTTAAATTTTTTTTTQATLAARQATVTLLPEPFESLTKIPDGPEQGLIEAGFMA